MSIFPEDDVPDAAVIIGTHQEIHARRADIQVLTIKAARGRI